jgi:hypothetical protein
LIVPALEGGAVVDGGAPDDEGWALEAGALGAAEAAGAATGPDAGATADAEGAAREGAGGAVWARATTGMPSTTSSAIDRLVVFAIGTSANPTGSRDRTPAQNHTDSR